MDQITYTKPKFSTFGVLNVHLGRKMVGAIHSGSGGFFYKPTRGPRGEVFPTIEAVKRSIEG